MVRATAAIVLACSCAGCAPREAPAPTQVEAHAPEIGPSASAPSVGEVFPTEQVAPASGGDPAEEVGSESEARDSGWRADGRPVWWISAAQREGGRVRLAGEALADSVVAARRGAIAAAERRLAQEGAGAGAVVERIAVRRLRGDAPGRERYVGYVLMSAPEGGG